MMLVPALAGLIAKCQLPIASAICSWPLVLPTLCVLVLDGILLVMTNKRIAVVPGDGIGKEVIPAAIKVVEATKAAVEFSTFGWSADRYLKDGTTIPPDAFTMLARDFDAIFVGALGDPRVP